MKDYSKVTRQDVIDAFAKHLDAEVENIKAGRQPQESDEAIETGAELFLLEINYTAQFAN